MTKSEIEAILSYVARNIISPLAFDERPASEVWLRMSGDDFNKFCVFMYGMRDKLHMEPQRTTFRELKDGTIFETYDKLVFMKIPNVISMQGSLYSQRTIYNAVRLDTGRMLFFDNGTMVVPVDVELNVK